MNKRWRDAWYLVRSDLIRFKFSTGFTLFFMAYIAGAFLIVLEGSSNAPSQSTYMKIMLDFVMLVFVPNLGYMINRRSLGCISNDSCRKHMIKLRTLPTDARTIVWSRYLSVGLYTLVNGLIFFGIQYLFISDILEPLTFTQFAIYVLTLIAYSLIMHTVYIQFEWRYSGKKYVVMMSMMMVAFLIAAIVIGLTGNNLFFTVIDLTVHWPILTLLVALLVIIQTFRTGVNLSVRTLQKIDLM